MSPTSSNPTVFKGDIWKDLDPRNTREFKVLDITGDRAIVQRASGHGPRSRIRLDRFKGSHGGQGKKGYVLVSREASEPASAAAGDAPQPSA